MTKDEAVRLQTRLGVAADGIIGRQTLAALFAKAGAAPERAAELALSGAVHMTAAGILDTPLRLAHFMAQLAHESGSFRYMEELASGATYEGRADLGNTQPGDGPRYKGRGPIQLTGRGNYRRVGQKIGVDLERHPELAAIPSIGLWVACIFWTDNGLNEPADRDDVLAVTRRINGGTNGLDSRKAVLAKMKGLLL
ncbi:glycoside hydrolase [Sphingomonas cannabina]|uniref:glycoside hydrolase family 19 protein n=1 Tax=Sphingomonas cannabina TaxID=2899123 RepID=UPI001F36362C|nr:glycoside hydrolase family 19 protein [Sphingomonas cannabina]UIJ43805.1 glycoside hydrolase [Sphingomonas cannabina]